MTYVYEQDAAKIKIEAWGSAVWDGKNLGFTDKPTVKSTPEYEDILTAQTGKIALGASLVAWKGEIVLPLKQTDLEIIRLALPWYDPALEAAHGFRLLPPMGTDLYLYAKLLTLHPLSAGAVLTSDINLIKAVPIGAIDLSARDGTKHDVLPVTFRVFPDRTQFPAVVIGYVGPLPGA